MSRAPDRKYVGSLPSLMGYDDYENAETRKLIRFRLTINEDGIELLGDSAHPVDLDMLLRILEPRMIQSMLCG